MMREDGAMADLERSSDDIQENPDDKIAGIAEQLRDDIHLGHIDGDVSTALRDRLEETGVEVREEDIDTIAEEIEDDASR